MSDSDCIKEFRKNKFWYKRGINTHDAKALVDKRNDTTHCELCKKTLTDKRVNIFQQIICLECHKATFAKDMLNKRKDLMNSSSN